MTKKLTCDICNTEFECGIENGDDKCWCFDYPNILQVNDKKCICIKCLKEKINDKKYK